MNKLELAQQALSKNRINEALKLFKEIINKEPHDISAYLGAAECFLRLKELQSAFDLCQKVLELKTDSAMAHVIMAYGYSELNESEKSYAHAKTACDLEPDSADAIGCYGTLLLIDGKIDDAIPILQKASTLNPQSYLFHNNLAYAYDMKGDTGSYLHESKALYRLRPDLKNARRVFGAYIKNNRLAIGISVVIMMLIAVIFRIQVLLVIPILITLLSVFGLILLLLEKRYSEFRRSAIATFILGVATLILYLIVMPR